MTIETSNGIIEIKYPIPFFNLLIPLGCIAFELWGGAVKRSVPHERFVMADYRFHIFETAEIKTARQHANAVKLPINTNHKTLVTFNNRPLKVEITVIAKI